MSDDLTIADGRTLSRSSMAISGVLFLTAQQLTEQDAQLKRWLDDVSHRPNGFASVDLRGLSHDQQASVHLAAREAFNKLSEQNGIRTPESVTYHALSDLIAMLDSMDRGEPPDTAPSDYVLDSPVISEDLNQIWKSDAD